MSSRLVHRYIVQFARSGLHLTAADIRRQAPTNEGLNLTVEPYMSSVRLPNCPKRNLLQQDNCPKHKSKLFTKWFHDNIIPLLLWISRSPDFNPIEYPWDDLELQVEDPVAQREHEKFPQLKTA
ncbi:hypothetical protein TELCIR_11862 [Teladorsagia circumcincta]|uniref:Tc1-like transposase DDE domain-containing protein n=1 Tax=Teladorsagia circumcincta TaxID=45464 RepID=A0A2G9U8A7_TELCI|nr:hypothetical protein TELCIR_11862 [Teladorsagia circumcincta]